MGIELYNDGRHACVMYTDLGDGDGDAVQSNQFLVIDNGRGALIDPGGHMTYNPLSIEVGRHLPLANLDYIFASHVDPDIVASLNRWFTSTDSKVCVSELWVRFVPHFCSAGKTEGRILSIPDRGGAFTLGKTQIRALPAHFLHAEGNFHFYDPVSKILFSGDMGTSLIAGPEAKKPVESFSSHVATMEGFHRRYMVSNKVCGLWARMVRQLDIEWMVPQHGRPFRGKAMIGQFLDWIEKLACGIDLVDQRDYDPALV